MKINIELNRESIRDFFDDAYQPDETIFEGAFPLMLAGKIYEHFFTVNVDLVNEKVKMTCENVFARYVGFRRYEDLDFEETSNKEMEIELSEQEKMLFLVAGEAFNQGKYKVMDEKENDKGGTK